jgi:hypothetical protein
MDFQSILTESTCGEACWHAREKICRCSCGGKNHGILNDPSGRQPDRVAKIAGFPYVLKAIGEWDAIMEQAAEINRLAGYKSVDEAHLVVDGCGGSPLSEESLALAAQERLAGKEVWWSQYHYQRRCTDAGAPARASCASEDRIKCWKEVANAVTAELARPSLLWVRMEMPKQLETLMVDKTTGLPLVDQIPPHRHY